MPAPGLNKESFIEWLWHLELNLNERDLWDPIFVVDPCGRRPISPKQNEAGYDKYRKLASKACSLIVKAAGYDNYQITEEFNARLDAVGMYDAILNTYAPRDMVGRFKVYRRLILFRKMAEETWQSTVRRSDELLRYMRLMYPPGTTAQEVIADMAMFALIYTLDNRSLNELEIEDTSDYAIVKKAVLRGNTTSGGQLSSRTENISPTNSTVCSFCEHKGHSTSNCCHFARHKRLYFESLSGSTSVTSARQSVALSSSYRRGDASSGERLVSIHVVGSADILLG